MRKWVKGGLALLCLLLLSGGLFWAYSGHERAFRGKRLSLWLKEAQGPSAFDSGLNDLIQEEGAEFLPYLIRALNTRDNPLWKPYVAAQSRAPLFLARRMPEWVQPERVRIGATYWLAAMGPAAQDAVPSLCKVATGDRVARVREGAVWALARIKLQSARAVSTLVIVLTKDADPSVRSAAAGGLEVWAPRAPEVIPALIQGLGDTNAVVREICAAALGQYGPQASTATDALQRFATSDDPAADYAARALKSIRNSR